MDFVEANQLNESIALFENDGILIFPFMLTDAPYITIFPKNVTILENDQAELSCRAVGKPPLSSYLWKHNGIVLTEASEKIYFPRATRLQGGKYTCAGINTVATGPEATAYLTVMCKYQRYFKFVGIAYHK